MALRDSDRPIFMTDGRTIMVEIVQETGDKALLDLVKSQYVFRSVLAPSLYAGFEFNDLDEPMRWWPLGMRRRVVVDPQRGFGAPIAAKSGVPTQVLASAYNVEKSYAYVSRWYEVEVREVKGYIRDSQQTTRCFRTRNAVVTVPARPNVSMENSGDFCTSASTGSSPWRVRAGLRMDSPWTSPQAATVCTEQGQPQRAGNPL